MGLRISPTKAGDPSKQTSFDHSQQPSSIFSWGMARSVPRQSDTVEDVSFNDYNVDTDSRILGLPSSSKSPVDTTIYCNQKINQALNANDRHFPIVSPTGSDDSAANQLFNAVKSRDRRRYRVLLSLVSTMTLFATAIAIISVGVRSAAKDSALLDTTNDDINHKKDKQYDDDSPIWVDDLAMNDSHVTLAPSVMEQHATLQPQSEPDGFLPFDAPVTSEPTPSAPPLPFLDVVFTPGAGAITEQTKPPEDHQAQADDFFEEYQVEGDPTLAPVVPELMEAPTARPTHPPTEPPTQKPIETERPTQLPQVDQSTASPSERPVGVSAGPGPMPRPTSPPTRYPTNRPTATLPPSPKPTLGLSITVNGNTASPVNNNNPVSELDYNLSPLTYRPGNLIHEENGLLFSEGLVSRVVAVSGEKVTYRNGDLSARAFHFRPDAGATFPDPRPGNEGGWVYASNSEMRYDDIPKGKYNGGVGGLTFDKDGEVIDYKMIMENTTWNCGGGRTPWNTWVSCEEQLNGRVYQVDPFGVREPEKLTLGSEGGRWESFAYDISDLSTPHFFLTEDQAKGAVQRFTPDKQHIDWTNNPWDMLHNSGTTEYLQLNPTPGKDGGTYEWTMDKDKGRINANTYHPFTEGIDCDGTYVYFVTKRFKQIFALNLQDGTYTNSSTVSGLFDGQPDQVTHILQTTKNAYNGNLPEFDDDLLYFTEEGGKDSGVHARDKQGQFFTILESPVYPDETTGLSFSPDGKHLFVAYQETGKLFQVSRADGYPFRAKSLDVKYHAMTDASRKL